MAIKEYRKKSAPELRVELTELRREQFKLRMAAASGQPRARTSTAKSARTSRG